MLKRKFRFDPFKLQSTIISWILPIKIFLGKKRKYYIFLEVYQRRAYSITISYNFLVYILCFCNKMILIIQLLVYYAPLLHVTVCQRLG